MTENTYYKPRLVIGNQEISLGVSGSVNFPGNNQANSLKCTITDPEFQNTRLFNKEVKFYLNYGSDDGVPLFRGFIKGVSPNDKQTSISAVDARTFISSQSSKMVELTDNENYDGYTLAAFLYDYINDNINTGKTYIGLNMLKDTNPSISMSGERAEPAPMYDLIKKKLQDATDNSDIEKPLAYFIDMIDDGNTSNITFVKEKRLTDSPSLSLSFSNGIKSYKYSRRAPANFGVGGGASFTYGNAPQGSVGMPVKGKFKDKNEARQEIIKQVLLQYRETDEINLQCNRGYYIALGSIVEVVLDKEDIGGNHRVTSKSIKFSSGGVNLSLKLNKKPLLLSEYI
tara:strand:+ start:1806 stop:2831 length:1026 start_codon:yes stop_codon:yes gene_type:complete